MGDLGGMGQNNFLCDLVTVRNCEDQEEMTINMKLPPGGKERNFQRKKDEPIARPLERIRLQVLSSLVPKKSKKKGRKECNDASDARSELNASDIACVILDDKGQQIPESRVNSDAWQTGHTLEVKFPAIRKEASDEAATQEVKRMRIETNLPSCLRLLLPSTLLAGDFLTAACARLEFCSAEDCKWTWFVEDEKEDSESWVLIGEGLPEIRIDSKYVGRKLKVRCEPACQGRIGKPVETISPGKVAGGPNLDFLKARQASMPLPESSGALRVMTYNILADVYAKTDYARDVLYPYVSPEHLNVDYRQQVALFEVLGFMPDILCMQEMDSTGYENYWLPRLKLHGFAGAFGHKSTLVEGCSTFWRTNKLQMLDCENILLRDLFSDSDWLRKHFGEEFAKSIESDSRLSFTLSKISTVAQFLIFRTLEGARKRHLLVMNTHLYFHPGASHVRNVSMAVMLAYAQELLTSGSSSSRPASLDAYGIILGGDLNSEPDTGVVELLASGSVSKGHHEWSDGSRFSWADRDEDTQGFAPDEELKYELNLDPGNSEQESHPSFDLANPFGPLQSADQLSSAFTNYVKGYIGSLDYIFFSTRSLKMLAFAKLPSERDLCIRPDTEEQQKQGYLPSQSFPSDHVSLVADLSFSDSSPGDDSDGLPTWPPPESRQVLPLPASRWNESQAANDLKQGKIIALPTDTLYGVAASAKSDIGIDRIYDAKQRPAQMPLALCLARPEDLSKYANTSDIPDGLVTELLPGPYTLLMNGLEDSGLSKSLNPHTSIVGIRVPDSSFARGVTAHLGCPIALTSANQSGAPSSTSVSDFRCLWQKCSHVYDGGDLDVDPSGSTIIDLSCTGYFKIVRKGCSLQAAQKTLLAFGLQEKL